MLDVAERREARLCTNAEGIVDRREAETRWDPVAGRDALESRGSNWQRRFLSAPLELKKVLWQQVARFDAAVPPLVPVAAIGGGGAREVLASGIGQGVVDRIGGGR